MCGNDADDRRYFAQRAKAERALSRYAASPTVRQVHRTFAERYEALASEEQPDSAPTPDMTDRRPSGADSGS